MRRAIRIVRTMALLALSAMLLGCSNPPVSQATPDQPDVNFDPCAERLHDICEQFLLYWSVHDELPQRLADLGAIGLSPASPLVCPTSHRPYVYDRAGMQVPGRQGRLIMYDAEPCHSAARWGILADPARAGEPLVLRVIRVPEPPHATTQAAR